MLTITLINETGTESIPAPHFEVEQLPPINSYMYYKGVAYIVLKYSIKLDEFTINQNYFAIVREL